MSAQAVGVLGVGTEPPPESRPPRLSLVIFEVSVSTLARSACVIWPIFSAGFIRPSKSATRACTGRLESRYAGRALPEAVVVAAPITDARVATAIATAATG